VTAPYPPPDLADRTPSLVSLARGQAIHRFYARDQDPIYYDRSRDGRLNTPDGDYGVLYAAQTVKGAFAETFLRSPGRRQIDPNLIARKAYVRLKLVRKLNLIDFDGPGLAILGATAEVVHGGLPYDAPQAWSKALRGHPCAPDGVAYTSRHDPSELCWALFGVGSPAVEEIERETALDVNWFWELAETYHLGRPPT